MKGIDTNVLVRYLVQDDADQSPLATAFIEGECSADEPGYVSRLVFCELVWVLESCYGQNRRQILKVLEAILGVAQLKVEAREVVWLALEDFRAGRADFSDHLLARANQACGCEVTVTLDRRAAASPGFQAL